MKRFLAAFAGATLLAAGAASAQMYQPMQPAPMRQMPIQQTGVPSWMQDDGSSSDHPTPMPGDHSGDRLNSQYRGGINVPPGQGLPAQSDQR
jgi:opacity protein-like surface antigen